MEQSSQISLEDLRSIIRRRKRPMLIAASAILGAAVLAALLWPPTYRATGTILIEQQEVPQELVRSTISSYADQRIQVISQRVMTSDNLYRIVTQFDLYSSLRRRRPREVVIERMRDDINFHMISADVIDPRSGNPTKATIAFAVGYQNHSPDLAAKVANELVSLYLQQNIESRKQRTADAETFLSDEAQRLDQTITTQQAQLATFKSQHLNDLPENSQVNVQLVTRADEELREIEARLRSLDQQVVYLTAQLAQISPSSQVYTSTGERVLSPADRLKFLRTEYARASALYAPDHPDIVRYAREIKGLEASVGDTDSSNDLARQLDDARTQLASARQKYAPDHPDVERLERLVASLGQQAHDAAAKAPASTESSHPDNPAYIEIKAQKEAAINERASLLQKQAQLKVRIAELENRLQQAPVVERDYSSMTRELENSQLKYREVRQKQLEAQVAQNLEEERKGERFSLIEPPLVPEEPYSPNRALILVLGLVLGTGAGVGTAAVQESADPRVRGRRDLTALLQVPPLAVIPWIETREDVDQESRGRRRLWLAAAGVLATTLLVIHFAYRPLDVLWQVVLRRVW